MELLFLTQTYPRTPEDLAGPFIRELALALVRGGDRVRVLAPHARGMPRRRDDGGVEVEAFRYAPAPLEVFGYGRSLAADERVRGASLLVAPLYAAGAWRAVRRAFRERSADAIQAHWIVPNGPLAGDAYAREAEDLVRIGGTAEAKQVAEAYVTRYPRGRHVDAMKKLLVP